MFTGYAFGQAPFCLSGLNYLESQDSLSLADSQAAIAAFLAGKSEGLALADSQAAIAAFLAGKSEGLALADSQEAVATYFRELSESLSIDTGQAALAAFLGAQAEGLALADGQTAIGDMLGAQAENSHLAASQTGVVKYPVAGFETISSADTQQGDFRFIRWVRTQQTIISQYANSPALLSLLGDLTDAIDPQVNIDAFYNLIWNVDTAVGYGLDVWGRIVNVSRILSLPGGRKFGYVVSSGAQDWDPLNQQQFYSGVTTTENYILADDAFRILILAKALANISNCAIPTYNRLLMQLFPNRGNVYVNDTGNMLFEIIFTFILQPFEIAIIEQSGVFVGPTGVGFTYQIILPQTLGFEGAGSTAEPYNQGIFFKGH